MKALILVATGGSPTMLAHIGIMRALNRHFERPFDTPGKKAALGEAQACTRPPTCVHPMRRQSVRAAYHA
jgi:hypothetical protein